MRVGALEKRVSVESERKAGLRQTGNEKEAEGMEASTPALTHSLLWVFNHPSSTYLSLSTEPGTWAPRP